MHIRILGHTVQLCHWQISYKMDDMDMVEYVPTEEEADTLVEQLGGVKTPLDTDADEWVESITIPKTSTQPKTDAEAIIALGKESFFDRARAEKQSENKLALAAWLAAHPLQWTDGKMYGTTQEDQSEMSLNLMQYQVATQSGQPATLEWHAQKEACRTFEVEEFTALSLKIATYVYPYLRYQESIKEQIFAAQTIEEINNVQIDYSTV